MGNTAVQDQETIQTQQQTLTVSQLQQTLQDYPGDTPVFLSISPESQSAMQASSGCSSSTKQGLISGINEEDGAIYIGMGGIASQS